MSNYTKTTDFAAKDNLLTGNPNKATRGSEVDTEFVNIATAIASKQDSSSLLTDLTGQDGAGSGLDADTLDGVQLSALGGNTTGNIGYLYLPQNSQSGNYTLVLTDAGKHILHPSGGGSGDTFTIPANASVAFPLGTVLTFVNNDSNSVSIAITSDTLTLAGGTTTGTRTLLQNGVAQAIKIATTTWIIFGVGLG